MTRIMCHIDCLSAINSVPLVQPEEGDMLLFCQHSGGLSSAFLLHKNLHGGSSDDPRRAVTPSAEGY